MGKKITIFSGVFFIFLICGGIIFFNIDEEPVEDFTIKKQSSSYGTGKESDLQDSLAINIGKRDTNKPGQELKKEKTANTTDAIEINDKTDETILSDASAGFPKTIEGIKEQIYSKNIEYVDQVELLDDLVQTGDADTREFWDDDWTSVDDWKKESNGFKLEKNDDGNLVFSPDEQTAKTYTFFENPLAYTYDEEHKEFVNEVDFYGKTIYNVAKFINDDVLVMMTISGKKVDLNIYQKSAARK